MIFLTGIWRIQRTMDLATYLRTQDDPKGQVREPLLHIDAIDCPPDILHMRKAIYTKLFDQVVTFSICQKRQKNLILELERIGIKFRYLAQFNFSTKNSFQKYIKV